MTIFKKEPVLIISFLLVIGTVIREGLLERQTLETVIMSVVIAILGFLQRQVVTSPETREKLDEEVAEALRIAAQAKGTSPETPAQGTLGSSWSPSDT